MVTVPDGVILEHELARHWSVRVERCRSAAIELLIAQSPDSLRGCGAVARKKIECRFFRDRVVLDGVPGIHLVDVIHRDTRYRLACGELLLDRVLSHQ